MSTDLTDLTSLTATMSLHAHHLSGSSTPPSSTEPHGLVPINSADRTPESHDYDLDPYSAEREHQQDGETKNGEKRSARRFVEPHERRTVFIPNLPRDATAREVGNMFAFAEGFLKVQIYDQLKPSGSTNEGTQTTQQQQQLSPAPGENGHTNYGCFVLFETPAQAMVARDRLHNLIFDATVQPPVILQARLAHKNLYMNSDEENQFAYNKTSRRNSFHGIHANGGVIPPVDYPAGALTTTQNTPNYSPLMQASTPPFHAQATPYPSSPYGSPLGTYAGALPNLHQMTAGYYSQADSGIPSPHQHQSPLSPQLQQQHLLNAFTTMQQQQNGYNSPPGYQQHRPYQSAPPQHHATHHYGNGHNNGHPSGVGPYNPPCTTLFLARLEALSNDELFQMMVNSFPSSLKDHKFMIDSKGQRIAFIEFDTIESAAIALQRINGYMGLACAFSKNPLNKRSS